MFGWPGWVPMVLVGLAAGSAACGEEARLLLTLERPNGSLDPLKDKRLTKFSLRIVEGGRSTDQEAFRGQGARLEVGRVPVDTPFDLRLAGRSSSGLMVGLGQVLDLRVRGDETTELSINFRKPLGYITGAGPLQALDVATDTQSQPELLSLSIQNGSSLAPLIGGVVLLVASGKTLLPVRTVDHQSLTAIPLGSTGACLAVGPLNHQALVCHPATQAISIVDLKGLSSGTSKAVVVPVEGPAQQVVFSQDRQKALILLDALSYTASCSGAKPSRLVELDLATQKPGKPQSLGRAVADLAVDPRDGSLVLAVPCAGKLVRMAGNRDLGEVKAPASYDLALADSNLVVVGRATGASVQGQVALFDLTSSSTGTFGSPQTLLFTIPPVTIHLTSQGTTSGYFGWAAEPQSFTAFGLEISPDSQRALILFEADYASNVSFNPCLYRNRLKAVGYLVLDLAASAVLIQRFTRVQFSECYANCVVNQGMQPLTDLSTCSSELKRVLRGNKQMISDSAEFEPTGAALLFGGS